MIGDKMGLFNREYTIEKFKKDNLKSKSISIDNLFHILDIIEEKDYWLICSSFLSYFYNNKITSPDFVNAFIVLDNILGNFLRGGVWQCFEYEKPENLEATAKYFYDHGNNELAKFISDNIHDYSNPKYQENFDYPNEWINESEKFDKWLSDHKKDIYQIEYNLLKLYKDSYTK